MSSLPIPLDEIRRLLADALAPGHFFVRPPASIQLGHVPAEELTWEIFHGRLLDASQTRRQQTFESWNLFWTDTAGRSAEPILAVKLDLAEYRLHVTRGIHCYGWEAYDAGNNTIQSREVKKWVRELVATIDVRAYTDSAKLGEDLRYRIFQAVIGTSRLPLTSLEAPLPAFTLGQLGYFPNLLGGADSLRSAMALLDHEWGDWELGLVAVKALELFLRAAPPEALADIRSGFTAWSSEFEDPLTVIPGLIEEVFNAATLSPYTDFVDRVLALLRHLEEEEPSSAAGHADVLAGILRLEARHLTAFDLETFHHKGANYPDALLLDAVLKALFALAERHSDLFLPVDFHAEHEARPRWLRLRGLRQGYFFRRRYEGLAVPEVPTSIGENMRVLPASFPHLSEEEILDPACRTRRLFADDPIESHLTPQVRSMVQISFLLLTLPGELQELGTALFLDRPLGIFKHPAEPDQTLLFSYVAFSKSIAARRLNEMRDMGLLDEARWKTLQEKLAALDPGGIPLALRPVPCRPGVPSLQDAFKVAPDFVLLRTTGRTIQDFLAQFDLEPVARRFFSLDFLMYGQRALIVGGGAVRGQGPASLTIYDQTLSPRLEFTFDSQAGHVVHRCHEYPAGGLRLVRVWQAEEWEPDGTPVRISERDVRAENIRIGPRG